jgi:ribonucleoside-diphosphate reductase alpha chain
MFKTAFELDQRWIIELAADRTPYICQGAVAEPLHPG